MKIVAMLEEDTKKNGVHTVTVMKSCLSLPLPFCLTFI